LVDEEYLASLRSGDEWTAIGRARELRRRGAAADDLLDHLVAAGERRAGELWLSGTWSLAEEHVATSVSEQVQAALVADLMRSSAGEQRVRPQVVVACAEGELHTLPARMVADRLRLAGCRTVFLGSVSSGQLRSVVHEWCPDAIVLSCTMAFNFAGLVRSLSAVSDADAPALIGGAAVSDAALAERLGADGWAEDATDLVRAVMGARTLAPRSGRRLWPEEPFLLQERLPALTGIALTAILERSQRLEPYDGWSLALTGELLEHLLTTAGAAVLVDDPSVLVAFAQWSATYLRHRGEHPLVLAASMVEVAARCEAELAGIGRFLRLAAEQVE